MGSIERARPLPESRTPEIPGYRVLAPLGSGGEGNVWLGEKLPCKTRVALKIHHPANLHDPHGVERIRRGIRVLKSLNCRGIARAIEEGQTSSGEIWLSTTLVEGRTLLEYVNQLDQSARKANVSNRRWAFPTLAVLDVFQKVCDCVQLAHRVGILHRDLKPTNVIVDSRGQPWIVDFGLARECLPAAAPMVTLPGQFVGSVEYASPEQIDGTADQIDQRSDLYSLGVMLYQFLTGAFPYDVRGPLPQVFDRIRFEQPVPPRKLAPWIDRDLQAIILKSVAKERERRYQSVDELSQDLKRYMDGRPVSARGDSLGYFAATFIRRHRVATAAAVVVIATTVTYAITMTEWYRRAKIAEARALTSASDARRRFTAARKLADFMVTQLDQELSKTVGAGDVRRRLLESAFEHLAELSNGDTDDPALMGDLACAHSKRADIAESIGHVTDGAVEAQAALDLRERLVAISPADPDYQADLSIAIVRVGDLAAAQGDSAKRDVCYERAMLIDEALVKRFPDNTHYLDNLSWSCNRLAEAANQAMNFTRSAGLKKRRREISIRLAERDPNNLQWQNNLLSSLRENVGAPDSPGIEGPSEALQRAREAMVVADRLRNADPANGAYLQAWLLTVHVHLDALIGAGLIDEGERVALDALRVAHDAAAREPEQPDWARPCVHPLLSMAQIAERRGDFQKALSYCDLARNCGQAVMADDRGGVVDRLLRASILYRMGQLQLVLGQSESAYLNYAEGIRQNKIIADMPGASALCLANLAECLLSTPCEELREPHKAVAFAERARELTAGNSPEVLLVLARAKLAVGDADEASRTAESAIRLLPHGECSLRTRLDGLLAAASRSR